MSASKQEFLNEVRNYTDVFERYLSEFTGYQIKLNNNFDEVEGSIEIDGGAWSPIFHPDVEEFILDVLDSATEMLANSTNLKEELDWELFEKIKSKLSANFIFGEVNDGFKDYRRIQFLKDLISLAYKTYEGLKTKIGIIYSSTENINKIADQYNFRVIKFDNTISIKELFEKEKPLLRLVDGEVLNLLMDNEYKIYGFALISNKDINLSESIIQDFENARLIQNTKAIKETLIRSFNSLIDKEYSKKLNDEILQEGMEVMLSIMKETIEAVSTDFEGTAPNFIYFKISNAEVNVYNQEDFVVSFSKGEWKIKNYHILQFVIMRQLLIRTQLYFLAEKSLEKSLLLENVVRGTNVLLTTLKQLSSTNTSSIVMILPVRPEDIMYSTELTIEEAKESLSLAPLKQNDFNSLYTKVIQHDGVHLNVKDVGVSFLSNLCSIDGSLVLDDMLNILSFGEIIDVSSDSSEVFGTGTNACKIASESGALAIKVSEDGDIKVYSNGDLTLTI